MTFLLPGITGYILFVAGAFNLAKVYKSAPTFNEGLNRFSQKEKNRRDLFPGTSWEITVFKYNAYRTIVAGLISLLAILTMHKNIILLGIVFFLVLEPIEKFWQFKMPFQYLKNVAYRIDKKRKDDELIMLLIFLKNMIIQLQYDPKGVDYIVDILKESAELTKPAFMKFLNYYRLHRPAEAVKAFNEEIGTELASDISRLFIQLDSLELSDIKLSLESIQNTIVGYSNTKKYEHGERLGDLCMIPITINLLLIAADYVMVVFFISQIDMGFNFFN